MSNNQRLTTSVIPFHGTPAPLERQGEAQLKTVSSIKPQASAWKGVFPHKGETFFARESEPGAICDIEIEGTCRYYRFWRVDSEADALYYAIETRFEYLHGKLRINNRPLCELSECRVITEDRGRHVYRLRITFRYSGEQIGIAFAHSDERKDADDLGSLRIRVTQRPDIRAEQEREEERRKAQREAERREAQEAAERRKKEKREQAELAVAAKPTENADSYRERWLRNIDRSSDDMTAILKRIHEGREKQLAQLAATDLDPEGEMYNQYKSEIDNWTAKQIMQFTERKGVDNGSATLIG